MKRASSSPSMSGRRSAVVTRSTTPASSCFFASAPLSQASTVTPGRSALSSCSIRRRTTLEPSTTITRGVSLAIWRVSAASAMALSRLAEGDMPRSGNPGAEPAERGTGRERAKHLRETQTMHGKAMIVSNRKPRQRRGENCLHDCDQHQAQHPCKRTVPEARIQKRPAHEARVGTQQLHYRDLLAAPGDVQT